MKNIIICEKPSVARTIASYLGTFNKHANKGIGYLENEEWVITWCFGHLVTLCYPEEYDQSLKAWSLDTLPFLPSEYKYRPIADTIEQFKVIKEIYHRDDIDTLYYCPDPAREGVLIQYLVRNMAGINPNIKEKMMWIDSITETEVKKAIHNAKDVHEYDNLRDAGVVRSIEDYAFGINFSRGLSKRYEKITQGRLTVSVGRVMTCVLAMVTERERKIKDFVSTPFYKINSNLQNSNLTLGWKANKETPVYKKIEPVLYSETGFKTEKVAKSFVKGLGNNQVVTKKETKKEKHFAPLLFNLSEIQATCSKMFKIDPKETLQIIQDLYEKRMVTYPRTDARVLSSAIANEIDRNIRGLLYFDIDNISNIANEILDNKAYVNIENTRYVNDEKIEDHYAIIPTGECLNTFDSLDELSQKIFMLIVKRFLAIFLEPACYDKTIIETKDDKRNECFYYSNLIQTDLGYLKIYEDNNTNTENKIVIKNINVGDIIPCTYEIIEGKTTPPKHYTTGSIILAMENAGSFIEDEELREQIKSSGIGTSATRAATLDKLINNKYLGINKKTQVLSTMPAGEVVYEIVKETVPELLNPKMTAEWERGLSLISDGKIGKDKYLNKLNSYITYYIDLIKRKAPNTAISTLVADVPITKKKISIQTYINVPYDDKDEAKRLGAFFDMNSKMWYVPEGRDVNKFTKWLSNGKITKTVPKKVYLNVSYDDKNKVKSLGARWDKDKKKWYTYSNNNNFEELSRFK